MKTVRIRSGWSGALPCGLATAIALLAGLAAVAPVLAQVNVPSGYEVVRLTDDEWLDLKPRINNLGHVIWAKRIGNSDGQEIFLYDGIRVRQITNNSVAEEHPDINDHGVMVWSRRVKPELYAYGQEIIVFDGTTERMITDDELLDSGPRINNLGHVTWTRLTREPCAAAQIMHWDGVETRVIIHDGFSNQISEINDFDQIAWTRYDECAGPSTWKGMIRLYTGREILDITDGSRQDQSVTINNRGLVGYYVGYPERGTGWWAHGRSGLLVEWGDVANVNDRARWVISRWYEEERIFQLWLWDDGPIRLTDSRVSEYAGHINDCDEVLWSRREGGQTDIMLMRLVSGDANRDGRITLADFAAGFGRGVTGPQTEMRFCEGPTADLQRDGDVDLHDFALMQAADVLPEHFERQVGCIAGPEPARDVCAALAVDFDRDGDVDLKDFAGFQAVVAK